MKLLGEQAVCRADLLKRAAAVESERGVMIFFSTLQFRSLLRGSGAVIFIQRGRGFFDGREQVRAFEQAAEIFFACDDFSAFLVAEIRHGFVFHFEPFEADDADVFLFLFPDLALAQFHADKYTNWGSFWKKSVPPDFCVRRNSKQRTVTFSWRQRRRFSSGWRCWPWIVFVMISSGWISVICRP